MHKPRDDDAPPAVIVSRAFAVNVGAGAQRTRVSSTQRIVQRDGRTEVVEISVEVDDDHESA